MRNYCNRKLTCSPRSTSNAHHGVAQSFMGCGGAFRLKLRFEPSSLSIQAPFRFKRRFDPSPLRARSTSIQVPVPFRAILLSMQASFDAGSQPAIRVHGNVDFIWDLDFRVHSAVKTSGQVQREGHSSVASVPDDSEPPHSRGGKKQRYPTPDSSICWSTPSPRTHSVGSGLRQLRNQRR